MNGKLSSCKVNVTIRDANNKIYECELYGDRLLAKTIRAKDGSAVPKGIFSKKQKLLTIYPDNNIYEGTFKKGMKDGRGKMFYANGDFFEGDWKNDVISGKGTYIWKNGEYYKGSLKNGARDGKGKMFYSNDEIYDGNWKYDVRSGKGRTIAKDGSVHSDLWHDGEIKKIKTQKPDSEISNYGEEHRRNVEVVRREFANGDIYEGEFNDDGKREGIGKCFYSDGDVYEGEWLNDRKDGKGKQIYANGDIYEGEWENDDMCGKGRYMWVDGEIYEGFWRDGVREGVGTCKYKNGYEYVGNWKNDQRDGNGKFIDENGRTVYSGKWKEDETKNDINKKYDVKDLELRKKTEKKEIVISEIEAFRDNLEIMRKNSKRLKSSEIGNCDLIFSKSTTIEYTASYKL
ncbi:MAG: hypothetical protein LBB13_01025 [Rickettsiales bacterium]|jgi:hypothetical protein|nr:hypothetical protein [Rickettsiales bacterium]